MKGPTWYVASLYGQERGDQLLELFQEDADEVSTEILASLRDYMGKPEPKLSASIIRSRISNLKENGEAVCLLVFMTMERGRKRPSQSAVFLGPWSLIMAKGQEIAEQFESYLQREGRDGDICYRQYPQPQ